jgi:CTP synthase (UTP-ammonia lyase)
VALKLGLIGDYDESVAAPQVSPRGVACAWDALSLGISIGWLYTASVDASRPVVLAFDRPWCVPASQYRNTSGALAAIRSAWKRGIPFLGTCTGIPYLLLECASPCSGWSHLSTRNLSPSTVALL